MIYTSIYRMKFRAVCPFDKVMKTYRCETNTIRNSTSGWQSVAEMQKELKRRWKNVPNRIVRKIPNGVMILDGTLKGLYGRNLQILQLEAK